MKYLKFYVFYIVIFIYISSLSGQEIVSTSGDYFSNPNGSISWSLGEPISEFFIGNENIFSQGFQQSDQNYTLIIPFIRNSDLIKIFPNPFDEIIHLQFQTIEKQLIVALYDEKMSLVKKTTILSVFSTEITLSFKDIESGVYFLHIYSENGNIQSIQKLIKKNTVN